jgi:hypothetical protein
VLTDAHGEGWLSIPIGRDVVLGSYAFDVITSATGYDDTPIGAVEFAVMSHANDVSLNDYSGHVHSSSSIHEDNHRHHHD